MRQDNGGSGAEIVLVVDNIDAVYRQAQRARAEIVRPLADYPWHMRQFWVRHPDGYLIRPAQRLLTVNPEIYRRQVIDAFREDKPRITQELLAIKQTADNLVQQQDYLSAATIYETLVTEIFDRSHLYYEEAEEYDDYDEYYERMTTMMSIMNKNGTIQRKKDWAILSGSVLKHWATAWPKSRLIE